MDPWCFTTKRGAELCCAGLLPGMAIKVLVVHVNGERTAVDPVKTGDPSKGGLGLQKSSYSGQDNHALVGYLTTYHLTTPAEVCSG